MGFRPSSILFQEGVWILRDCYKWSDKQPLEGFLGFRYQKSPVWSRLDDIFSKRIICWKMLLPLTKKKDVPRRHIWYFCLVCLSSVCAGSRNSTPKMLISCCQENRGLIKLRDYLEKNPWRFIIPQGWGYLGGNVGVSRPLRFPWSSESPGHRDRGSMGEASKGSIAELLVTWSDGWVRPTWRIVPVSKYSYLAWGS